ncbi:glycosyltransferase family 39 protein [Paenibacillus tyrfis]|uniref:Uncharacterized protein n=1 Tax=Paenibacillus tyrfis TaxID=1501230 RepID=A0A081PB75_9BACL|nr:glycosyltransferase family 39 protein [Paenibacillus tyrfis]KEQ27948.1 hypothetical protein ET33_00605 [Paenibacillus tyrfis]
MFKNYIISSGVIIKLNLALLFLVNFIWFNAFKFNTLMGDDLSAWDYFQNYHSSFLQYSFLEAVANKYRPVYNIIQYILFDIFGKEYKLFFFTNILFNFIIVLILYKIIYTLTKTNFISFIACLLFITSRFSYYNIIQVFGLMEALGLFFFVLIIYNSIKYYQSNNKKIYIINLLILNCLIIFTHERYIVLLPFLIFLVLAINKNNKYRMLICGILISENIFNFILKKLLLKTTVLEGTGGRPLDFDFLRISKFFISGLGNMFGLNIGDAYLNGLPIQQSSNLIISLSIILALLIIAIFIIAYCKLKDNKNCKLVIFLSLILFSSILLAASITIRQEYRWLLAPYILFLIVLSVGFNIISKSSFYKYLLVSLVALLTLSSNIYYKSFLPNVFFVNAEMISDSVYKETIEKYGNNISRYEIFIQKHDSLPWTLLDSTFFKVYTNKDMKINYVNNLSKLNINKEEAVLLFKLDDNKKFINVTENYIELPNENKISAKILPQEWSSPEKKYPQNTLSGDKLVYKLIPKLNKKKGLMLKRMDTNQELLLSDNVIDNESISLLESGKFAYYNISEQYDIIWIPVPAGMEKINWETEFYHYE